MYLYFKQTKSLNHLRDNSTISMAHKNILLIQINNSLLFI